MGGVTVSEYRTDGHSLPAEEFIIRHGNGFLLHRGGLVQNELSVDQTLDIESTGTLADKTTASTDRFVVFPIPADGHHAPAPKLLSVGRMPTNEVVRIGRMKDLFSST